MTEGAVRGDSFCLVPPPPPPLRSGTSPTGEEFVILNKPLRHQAAQICDQLIRHGRRAFL
jgi:hypothetical protein